MRTQDAAQEAQSGQDDQTKILQRELVELEQATSRLYEAVEKGFLPMDDTLQKNVGTAGVPTSSRSWLADRVT